MFVSIAGKSPASEKYQSLHTASCRRQLRRGRNTTSPISLVSAASLSLPVARLFVAWDCWNVLPYFRLFKRLKSVYSYELSHELSVGFLWGGLVVIILL